jgi:hypothetical protein
MPWPSVRTCRLVPGLARWVLGPVEVPPFRALMLVLSSEGPVPFQPDFVVVIAEHFAMHQLEHASLLPLPPIVDSRYCRCRTPWESPPTGSRCEDDRGCHSTRLGRACAEVHLCGSDDRVESEATTGTRSHNSSETLANLLSIFSIDLCGVVKQQQSVPCCTVRRAIRRTERSSTSRPLTQPCSQARTARRSRAGSCRGSSPASR